MISCWTKGWVFRAGMMIVAVLAVGTFMSPGVFAQGVVPGAAPGFNLNQVLDPSGFGNSMTLLLALSAISLIPFLLISTTSFVRIVIVLSLLRQALGTQSSPPNPVIISIAMFLTVFVMTPTFIAVNENAIKPYQAGTITQAAAFEEGFKPFRIFMLKQTRDKDLALFMEFSRMMPVENYDQIPPFVLIPAFMISELKTAFQIGFLLFIPFLVIDLIISNILLSLGMMMLSPAMISMPFKLLLFVLVDGWNLVIRGILTSFY